MAKVIICNRSRARAAALAGHIGAGATAAAWDLREELLEEADLLVNCTSLGMTGQPELEIRLDPLKKSAIVTDIGRLTGSGCCCIRQKQGLRRGSASNRRSMKICAVMFWMD